MIRPEWNEWTYPPRRTIDWPGLLAVLTGLLWGVVLVLWFFSGYLWTYLWILALYIDVPIRVLSIALTAVSILTLVRRRRWPAALFVAALCASVLLIVFLDVWTTVYPRVWFWTHRDQFVAAERMVRSGAIPAGDSFAGAHLPAGIDIISVDGSVSATSAWDTDGASIETCGVDGPILFAPAWVGIPDGATGFVQIPCDAGPALVLDGYSDPMCPAYPLADGWWWADGVSCSLSNY